MLKKLGLCVATVGMLAGCTTSQKGSAATEQLNRSTRGIVGTGLIGAMGATDSDQDKIDDTIAGLCGAGSYTKTECARHSSELANRSRVEKVPST